MSRRVRASLPCSTPPAPFARRDVACAARGRDGLEISDVVARGVLIASLVGAGGCSTEPEVRQSLPVVEAASCPTTPVGLTIDTLATGLDVPWGVSELADGRILLTERPGRIRVIQHGHLQEEPWAVLDAAHISSGEGGLLGIAVDEQPERTDVYVARVGHRPIGLVRRVVRRLVGWHAPLWSSSYTLDIVRYTDRDGRGADPTVILGDLPTALWNHSGGELRLGPDRMLYLGFGDAGHPGLSRTPAEPQGSILRVALDGSVPADNPWSGQLAYAIGLRNVQGLDWVPGYGAMLAVEHGPTGGEHEMRRRGQDELNHIVPGGDYGWPVVAGGGGVPEFIDPVQVWHPVFAPARLRFVRHADSPWLGSAFVTALRAPGLVRLQLRPPGDGASGWGVSCQEVVLPSLTWGRLRALATTVDGSLLVGTSNRDGRGTPRPGDDLLLRVSPVSERSN